VSRSTPGDGALLLATHAGLVEVGEGGELTPIGPVIDLMGFAASGAEHYVASGHPGLRVDLPQPVGLIESTDGGRTWAALSRQGQSDFHALTVSDAGVLGFDGSLVRSGLPGESGRPLGQPYQRRLGTLVRGRGPLSGGHGTPRIVQSMPLGTVIAASRWSTDTAGLRTEALTRGVVRLTLGGATDATVGVLARRVEEGT
jgi:hypothetical protein